MTKIRKSANADRCGKRNDQPVRKIMQERVDAEGLTRFFTAVAALHPEKDDVVFVCIGTDRSTGDAFGPFVGTFLMDHGFRHVVGTMEHPCDSERLEEAARLMSIGKPVIAVDACLGRTDSIGLFLAAEGPLYPAASIGRLPGAIGHYSIAGVVNRIGPKPYWTLQTTSLRLVMDMARAAADAAGAAWGMER